jgi:shikimate dehydrogenase
MDKPYSLGLIGYPLLHSLSPRLHTAALRQMGLTGEYRLYPIEPGDRLLHDLRALLGRARAGEIHGLNVTIPHKQAVIPLLDELTPQAQAIGAVNTILVRDGRLVGENTDAPGFLSDLGDKMGGKGKPGLCAPPTGPESAGGWPRPGQPGSALVLGAGGAARAVVYALLAAGWQVSLAARRVEQAEALASSFQAAFPGSQLRAIALQSAAIQNLRLRSDALPGPAASIQLLVNATSAGMLPDAENSPWPEDTPFPARVFVYDLVYKPPETRLLRAARQAGLRASNGLGMLIEQAALALETWTGQPVPRQAMLQAVAEFNVLPIHPNRP